MITSIMGWDRVFVCSHDFKKASFRGIPSKAVGEGCWGCSFLRRLEGFSNDYLADLEGLCFLEILQILKSNL